MTDTTFNPHRTRTIDGVLIVPGLVVWDYNLRVSTVTGDGYADRCPLNPDSRYVGCTDGDHWFDTTGGMFNGSRMWVRHPSTGKVAAR